MLFFVTLEQWDCLQATLMETSERPGGAVTFIMIFYILFFIGVVVVVVAVVVLTV